VQSNSNPAAIRLAVIHLLGVFDRIAAKLLWNCAERLGLLRQRAINKRDERTMLPKRPSSLFAGLLSMALLASHGAGAQPQRVDLVIKGGKVLTIDPAFSIRSAIAINGGRIVAVGGEEIARDYKATKTIDLNGRVLMPGFMDTHLHVHPEGRRDVELTNARSIADLQQRVRAKAQELGPGKWVTGMEWDEAQFADKRNPTRQDLDAAAPNNPVILVRAGRHSTVGNSAALKLAGITRDTPQPDRGVIEHDAKGDPNGMIRERADLYRRVVPALAWDEVRDSYIRKLKVVLQFGITSLIEASGSIDDEPVGAGGEASSTTLGTFRQVQGIYAQHGVDLPRMAMYISYPGAERLKAYPHHTGYGDDRLRLGPIGESAVDGGFTGPTAWTLVDYKGLPGFRGKGRYSDAELQELTDTSARLGWQVGLHAIGDAAIVQTVGAYAKSPREHRGRRP